MKGSIKKSLKIFKYGLRKIYFNVLQQNSKNDLEKLFNSIDEFIFIVNKQGKIIHFNKSVTQKLGYTSQELQGLAVELLHPANKRLEAREIMAELFAGKVKSCPIPIQNKKGELIPVETKVVQSTWGSEKAWIGISRDISDRIKQERILAYRLQFEELMTKTALRFLSLDYTKIDKAINQSLKQVGKLLEVDRSYVFLFKANMTKMDNTHEWCNIGIKPQIEILQDLDSEAFPWWMDQLRKNKTINITNIGKLPTEAENEKRILLEQNIKSIIVVPMFFKNELIGFIGFDAVKKYTNFSVDSVKLLNILSSIITNAIIHKRNNIKLIDYQNNLENEVSKRTEKIRETNRKLRNEILIRKETERELKKWYIVIEQSAVSVYITDIKGNIEYVNPQVYLTSGYKSDELIGKNIKLFKLTPQYPIYYKNFWKTILKGEVWRGIVKNKTKNGEIIWEYEIISPVKNKKGKIINFIIVRKDITSEKKMESQMIQSMKMEALGKLAGGIAHDVNNILQIISVYTDLLLYEPNNKEGLKQIRNAIERGSEMLGALLDYSKNNKTSKKVINLDKVFENFINTIKPILPSTITLNFNFKRACKVMGNKTQLEEVLLNLILNAKDSITNKGKINIELKRTETIDKDSVSEKQWIILIVQDNGKGMDKEIIKKIFDPFFTTKELGKGTGLGLSIVSDIVKQHNGFIEVETKLGEGSLFRIYLPENKQ